MVNKLSLLVMNKINCKTFILGLAILVTVQFLNVASAQEKKELVLKLLSQQQIEKPKRTELSRIILSKNGKFKGTIVLTEAGKYPSIYKFTLFDSLGNTIWEKDTFNPYPDIANDGSVITTAFLGELGPKSMLYFYDPAGNLIRKDELWFELTPINSEILPEGNNLLLKVRKTDAQSSLLVLDTKGNLIKNYGPCDNYAVSPGLMNLIISSGSELRFYRNGNLIGKKKVESQPALGMVISPDGDYFAFLTRNRLSLFEIDKVKKLWQKELENNLQYNYNSIDLSQRAEKVAVGATANYEMRKTVKNHIPVFISIFDQKGKKIAEQKIEVDDWDVFVPGVKISEDGSKLTVKTIEDIYKFELEQ